MGDTKNIICQFCGAEFDEMLPKCPYCDSTNIKGAEAEYMDKLEDVRSDMEDLAQVPMQETKKELKKQTKLILIVVIAIVALLLVLVAVELAYDKIYFGERDKQADYVWQQENYPILDELYEQENYDELYELYYQAVVEDKPIYNWEHYEFCAAISNFMDVEEIWAREKAGESLSDWEYVTLLYMGFRIKNYEESTSYTQQEKEKLAPYIERVRADFEVRWSFTEEELAAFEKEAEDNNSWVSYEYCEKYIEKWRKGK